MSAEEIREYCLKKPHATESFPFDNVTLVFKVGGKIFLLLSLEAIPLQFNLKCEPQKAQQLRERYSSVLPGYHMNKNHWNTVIVDGSIPLKTLCEWIDESYELVLNSLPKKVITALKTE